VIRRVSGALGGRFAASVPKSARTRRASTSSRRRMRRAARRRPVAGRGRRVGDRRRKDGGDLSRQRYRQPRELDAYHVSVGADGNIIRPSYKPPSLASVIIPTTLSAGEHSAMAGCTDSVRNVKEMYIHRRRYRAP